MKSSRTEYHLLKRSIEQFRQDLCKLENLKNKKIFSNHEFFEIMISLTVVKDDIGRLEKICVKMIEEM